MDISLCHLLLAPLLLRPMQTLREELGTGGGKDRHLLESQGLLPREKGTWLLGAKLLGCSITLSFLAKVISHF